MKCVAYWTHLCQKCFFPFYSICHNHILCVCHHVAHAGGAAGPAGSYVSGSALVVDGAQWLYKKPGVPMDVVLKASRGDPAT